MAIIFHHKNVPLVLVLVSYVPMLLHAYHAMRAIGMAHSAQMIVLLEHMGIMILTSV